MKIIHINYHGVIVVHIRKVNYLYIIMHKATIFDIIILLLFKGGSYMNLSTAMGAGVFFAIIATILLCIFVVPEKKGQALSGFLLVLHDIFNFKNLLLEKIVKVLYVFATCICIFIGFFMIFARNDYYYYSESTFLPGILLMILGPIFVRITYELLMMTILLVKNVIAINNKLTEAKKGENISADSMN